MGLTSLKSQASRKTPERIPDNRILEFQLKAAVVLTKIKNDVEKVVDAAHKQATDRGEKLKASVKPIAKQLVKPVIDNVDRNTARHINRKIDRALQPKEVKPQKQKWPERDEERFYYPIEPEESEYYDSQWSLELTRPDHIKRDHWKELVVDSGIDPAIASATFRSVNGKEAEKLILDYKYNRIKKYGGTYTSKQKKALKKAYQHSEIMVAYGAKGLTTGGN